MLSNTVFLICVLCWVNPKIFLILFSTAFLWAIISPLIESIFNSLASISAIILVVFVIAFASLAIPELPIPVKVLVAKFHISVSIVLRVVIIVSILVSFSLISVIIFITSVESAGASMTLTDSKSLGNLLGVINLTLASIKEVIV